MSVGVMKDYKLKQRNLLVSHTLAFVQQVYLEQNKKKAEAEVKIVTMWSQEKPIQLV